MRGVVWCLAWGLGGALWLLAGSAHAASLAWRVSPEAPTVGDRIAASLELNHGAGQASQASQASQTAPVPLWDDVAPRFDGAEVDPLVDDSSATDAEGNRVDRRTYTLYADLPGTVTLPSVTLPLATGGSVTAAALSVTVAGVFDPAQPPPLAPAKGPLGVPLSWGVYALVGGVLLVLLAALWWWWMRRRAALPASPASPAVPPRPARELALERLDALDAASPGMSSRTFFGELSAITCAYLAGRYGIPAPVMSRVEIEAAIGGLVRDRRHAEELAPVSVWLSDWELFKFARVDADDHRRRRDLNAVRAWIVGHRENIPVDTPVDTPADTATPPTLAMTGPGPGRGG